MPTGPMPLSRAARPALSALLALLLGACATPLPAPIAGYTCCNLRDYGGWISSHNIQGGTLVPVGEPIAITAMKRDYYGYGKVAGREVGLRDDHAKTRADALAWMNAVIVKDDPRPQVAAWPQDVRAAVAVGRVMRGMTRQQVLVALGHPARADTPDLAAPAWRYWTAYTDETVDVRFGDDGRVVELAGKPAAVRAVQMEL